MLVKTRECKFLWPKTLLELDSVETYRDSFGCIHFKITDGERVFDPKTNIVIEYIDEEKQIKEKEWAALLKG